jgi:hypothetical protein
LNVLVFAAVLIVSYFFIRRFYPDSLLLRIGVPLLLATFPQDVFFSINSDVPLALSFLVALYLLLEWSERRRRNLWLGIFAGLSTAAAFLVKYSNVAILVLLGALLVRKFRRSERSQGSRETVAEIVGTALAAGLPILAWLTRNYLVLGDFSGTAAKSTELGWTRKPLGELLSHPLFTPSGFEFFWSNLLAHFWRGEIVWHLDELTPPVINRFFVFATTVLLVAAAVRMWKSRRIMSDSERVLDWCLLSATLLSVGFLGLLSLLFDFGNCPYPSREEPYFISGRLITGVLVPVLILLVR